MKEIIKKYFDFIGVKNEGKRRLTLVLIITLGFLLPFILGSDMDYYLRHIFFDRDFEDSLILWSLILFPSPIIVGVIVKITNWVKEGFKK